MALGREELLAVTRLRPRGGRRRSGPARRLSAPGSPALWAAAFGLATLVARLLYAASGPTDWDSVQYVVGSEHFDVTHGAPQPPGYWLYVALGHVVHVVSGLTPTSALVLLAALASAGAAAATVAAGWALGGRFTALSGAALVATAPVSWFNGSIVATYSFDALTGALLVLLARRARPGSFHGVVAVVVYALATGLRPSAAEVFLVLVLIPVMASTRGLRQWMLTLASAVAAMALWFVPMVEVQPGGLSAWWHATRLESAGAADASSIFVTATGGRTNLGTFAAWALLTMGPALVLGLVATVVLGLARAATRRPAGDVTRRIWSLATNTELAWYQRSPVIVAAAVVPPLGLVTLVQFAKGGYLLSFLPAATVALLLPVSRLVHHRQAALRHAAVMIAGVALVAACGFNIERFTEEPGILPRSFALSHPWWWISQARYQSPYADTASTIAAADRADTELRRLGAMVDPSRDVVVALSLGAGLELYRNIGAAVPGVRVALVSWSPPILLYEELGGLLYYDSSTTVAVGPGGYAYVLTAPPASGLATEGTYVATLADFRVWRLSPGAQIGGVRVVADSGTRPLGTAVH
ncbi:MAG TPA: hypothetical protein VMV14_03145 [Acidimicrobiales bacterium]|nr:hypothetical protein [Acidimicrobiales bacterium]